MINRGLENLDEIKIQKLVNGFLNYDLSKADSKNLKAHLDEDALTAFVEGNIAEREAQPIVSHLVDCSYCRNITAELTRLTAFFSEDKIERPVATKQPSKISEILSRLFSGIIGTGEDTVFAHEEKKDEKPPEDGVEDSHETRES